MRTHKVLILATTVGLSFGLAVAQGTDPDKGKADTRPSAEKVKAERKAMSEAIAKQRKLAREEAKNKAGTAPVAAAVSPVDESSDAVLQALRKRQADLEATPQFAATSVDPKLVDALRKKQAELVGNSAVVLQAGLRNTASSQGVVVVPAAAVAPTVADANALVEALRKKQAEINRSSAVPDELVDALRKRQSELSGFAVKDSGTPVQMELMEALRKKQMEVAGQPSGPNAILVSANTATTSQLIEALRKAQADADASYLVRKVDAQKQLADSEAIRKQLEAQEAARKQSEALEAERAKAREIIAARQQEALRKQALAEEAARKKADQLAEAKKLREQNEAKANAKKVVAQAVKPIVVAQATTKEQKLSVLLKRYQNDEITPTQYHMERAKIVSE